MTSTASKGLKLALTATAAAFAASVAAAIGIQDRIGFAKKAAEDGICTVTAAQLLSKADPEGKDPLEMWRAEAKETVTVTDAFVRIDFTLSPEKGSCIKCRAELSLPEKWDGRFWGQGNSGRAGSLPSLAGYIAENTAVATTDLGTRAAGEKTFMDKSVPWPACVRRDFEWRATHLMTVYGKRIAKAFYGRDAAKSYFFGGSTGGRQGMSEAIRFPEDYDGIIAVLPDNNAAASEISQWHLRRQTHDATGKLLFTDAEMRAVADSAIEWLAKRDPAPYAGYIVADGRFTEAELDEWLAFAATKCPSISDGDKIARLKAIYMPLMHDGKCYFNGFAPGTYHGPTMRWGSLVFIAQCLAEKGFVQSRWNDVGWREIDLFLEEFAPEFNSSSADLSAFRARGGKLIMTTGWEDQTIPPAPIIDYYERVCEAEGGLGRTSGYFRLFCIPGCAHGGGKGRVVSGSPGTTALRRRLVEWREKGTAPESISCWWKERKLSMPVAPYPGLFVQESGGGWKIVQTDRKVARLSPECTVTATKGFEDKKR